jgi:hypothetical protein
MENLDIAKTIISQIHSGRVDRNSGTQLMMCWGFRKPNVVEQGVEFNVSGLKYRGIVRVVLDFGTDTYSVILGKYNKKVGEFVVKSKIDGVYCDQLTEIIDGIVEK